MTEKDTQNQIQEQLRALKKATENATKSQQAAKDYLISAGIITKEKEGKFPTK